MLDSTLEIAFKEFLVNESGMSYSDGRLQGMFRERAQVHKEMRRHVRIAESDWKKIEYYYLQRCHLIHRRAAVTIPDGDIRDFRLVVERVLRKLFRLHF